MLLHDPHPIPARVASITALALRLPEFTQATIAPLLTPLQLQTWVLALISAKVTCFGGSADIEQQMQALFRQAEYCDRRSGSDTRPC